MDESDTVIMWIGRKLPDWEKVVESSCLNSNDVFPLILHILAQKVCTGETILVPNQIEIITRSLQGQFISQIQKQCSNMFMGEKLQGQKEMHVDQSRIGILTSVYTIFTFISRRCPKLAHDYVAQIIPGCIGVLSTMMGIQSTSGNTAALQELLQNFQQLLQTTNFDKTEKAEMAIKKNRNRYEMTELEETALHEMDPPDDFREIPIVPSIEEIHSGDAPFLRTNKRVGSYLDAHHYLDVHFRLLREDFVHPLRKGIQDFMNHR